MYLVSFKWCVKLKVFSKKKTLFGIDQSIWKFSLISRYIIVFAMLNFELSKDVAMWIFYFESLAFNEYVELLLNVRALYIYVYSNG